MFLLLKTVWWANNITVLLLSAKVRALDGAADGINMFVYLYEQT